MELEKKLEKQHNLLDRLYKELAEAGATCSLDVEPIPGTDRTVEILRMLTDDPDYNDHPDAAEFYFLNTELSAPDLIYFTAMVTLREDIKYTQSIQLLELITMINQSLPFGAFKLDMNSGLLSFRLDAIYNATLDDDVIYPHLTATAANMLNASNTFAISILEVCDEEITAYEAMKLLKLGTFAER